MSVNAISDAEEAVARVLYSRHGFKYCSPVIEWDALEDQFREPWLEDAWLAINAVLHHVTEVRDDEDSDKNNPVHILSPLPVNH